VRPADATQGQAQTGPQSLHFPYPAGGSE
jgi:hypothetical protein